MPQNPPQPSFITIPDTELLTALKSHSKFKQRSHDTHHPIHIPELTYRLGLPCPNPPSSSLRVPNPSSSIPPIDDDAFVPKPNLSNMSDIEVILLGNSMLERFKTTGREMRLGRLCEEGKGWNGGVGGDTSENMNWRVGEGLFGILKEGGGNDDVVAKEVKVEEGDIVSPSVNRKRQGDESGQGKAKSKLAIKLWILASGTNDIHKKKGLRAKDIMAYEILLQACLRIAPKSKILACDIFYRKDIDDQIVERANKELENVVESVNDECGEVRVKWIEARGLIGRDMLVDHVHLSEEGYEVWDEVLWRECRVEGVV